MRPRLPIDITEAVLEFVGFQPAQAWTEETIRAAFTRESLGQRYLPALTWPWKPEELAAEAVRLWYDDLQPDGADDAGYGLPRGC